MQRYTETNLCDVLSCGKTQSVNRFPSDPYIMKVQDSIASTDQFKNRSQFDAGFSEKLKVRRCCADFIGSDINVTTQVWVTNYFVGYYR